MKINYSYIIGTLLSVITLTSFEKKNSLRLDDKKNSTSESDKLNKLLSISQSVNLGEKQVQLHQDTVYTALAFSDPLFTPLPMGYEDKIMSFYLPKGYMVVFAENSDGTGESACFAAIKSDIKANLPKRLQNNISFIRYMDIDNCDKKGAASIKDASINALGSEWFYGWSLNRLPFPNQQFVPMTWGKTNAGDEKAKYLIDRNDVNHLLSFNEPDGKGQSNIQDFDTAIVRYKIMQKTGLRLGSPATTQGQAFGDGKWLTKFMDKANKEKARVDFIALHWYDWGNQNNNNGTDIEIAQAIFKRFVAYMEKVHANYPDKPLWLTEFNANVKRTSEEVHKNFMELATQWMNEQDYIERYAYFFEKNHPETNADNSLTPIGKLWKSLKTTKSFNGNIIGDAKIIK